MKCLMPRKCQAFSQNSITLIIRPLSPRLHMGIQIKGAVLYHHSQRGGYIAITLSVRLSVCPSIHTFVTDISASTGRNDFIFDIWLWHGDLYCVSPIQVYRTSTSCFLCDLQMNEWGYSQHDVACNILFFFHIVQRVVNI